MIPKETITQFDEYLVDHNLSLDAVVIGGAALALLEVVNRQTRDCDILHPELSEEIKQAALDFAEERRKNGDLLADDWLNNGPASLTDVLPDNWMKRLQLAFQGRAIVLRCLGRLDLLRSKVFALCDRGTDLQDC